MSFLWFNAFLLLISLCAFVYLLAGSLPEVSLRLQKRTLTLVGIAGLLTVVAQLRNALIGVVSWDEPGPLREVMVGSLLLEGPAVLCLLLATRSVLRSEREEVGPLRRSASVDPLTSLYNQAHFRRAAARRMVQARRYGAPLSLALLDLDDFESYSEAHGPEAGSARLREVSGILRRSVRADDLLARYGPEGEFAMLLICEQSQAEVALERIRATVESLCAAPPRPMTVSVGVSALGEKTRSVEDLLERAETALYQAKSAGKNRVVTSPEAA